MKRLKVTRRLNDIWQFLLIILVLILFAYFESRNRPTTVYSYSKEIKYLPGNANAF